MCRQLHRTRIAIRIAVVAISTLVTACSAAPRPMVRDGSLVSFPFNPQDVAGPRLMARVCAPRGAVGGMLRYPVALINHGSPAAEADPEEMQPAACDSPQMQWFTRHGYVAVALMRRGFGGSGGAVRENVGVCAAPDYAASAQTAAQDIAAGLRGALALDIAAPDGAIVVGQSTGGWGVLAYSDIADAHVRAAVVFAPGRGAHAFAPPDSVCRPDLLEKAASRLGAKSHLPLLWVAAENDSYIPPDVTERLHDAFTRSGGQAQLAMLPSFGSEGHFLFSGENGPHVWGGPVKLFLSRLPPP